ncbi:hypothetical protein FOLKNPGA_01651 [Legionella sp. PC1000]|uniref:hypothetical protein n=1 Tax=Legionella sp. PC1000 TaxID=2746060 RepID=UPI0015F9FFA5|nr:hypothetical protein [Legionella sp. PC1000]QLZ68871.1 hypothetical protein FOLKNPGA_01651 [Legionella sp. PC1000]
MKAKKESQEELQIKRIFGIVEEYNQDPKKEPIQFIHGGSSAPFAFMGKTVSTRQGTQEIPQSLIPTGILRKKYGIYPISGELSKGVFGTAGSRKLGVNYDSLSGMGTKVSDIEVVYGFANRSKRHTDIHSFHQNMENLITQISPATYLTVLKMLVMTATNLMIMDANGGNEKRGYYLQLLQNEKENLLKRTQDPEGKIKIVKYFAKYMKEIGELLAGENIPFIADDLFIRQLFNQYPIIYCSTAKPIPFSMGSPDEQIYTGELDMQTVKLLFTPEENVQELHLMLDKLGLSHIQVHGFTLPQKTQETELDTQSEAEEFDLLLKNLQRIDLGNRKITNSLIKFCMKNYFSETGQSEYLEKGIWLLQRACFTSTLDKSLINELNAIYREIHSKVQADPNYIEKTCGIISTDYYQKLQAIEYVYALIECRRVIKKDDLGIFDYSTEMNEEVIDGLIHREAQDPQANIFLENLHFIFSEDLKKAINDFEIQNLEARIKAIDDYHLKRSSNAKIEDNVTLDFKDKLIEIRHNNVGEPEDIRDLINEIDGKIVLLKQDQEKYPTYGRYPHKINVLEATKDFLRGEITLKDLEKKMEINHKYDKGNGLLRTGTGKLVDRAVELQNRMNQRLEF